MLEVFAVAVGALAVYLVAREPAAAGGLLCGRCATWKDPGEACPRCGAS